MSDLSILPELAHLNSGRGIIRIPSEQDVPFTKRIQLLIDTPEFRRLAEISQLGLVALVYPGARHSRFEHALGVYHNGLRYLAQLAQIQEFGNSIDPHLGELLIVSALLHDLGHWPFCHPIEDLGISSLQSHESYASRFLGKDNELTAVLIEEWKIEPSEVLEILGPRSEHPHVRLLQSILSGPIDIDKMDYLERDSLHTGVPYGRHFDKQRLIQSLCLNQTGDQLALSSKGRTAAELMVFARYVMFSEVYWHHAVRSATSMFGRAFYSLLPEIDPTDFFLMTESRMISELSRIARGKPEEQLLQGIFGSKRMLYKRVSEFSHFETNEIHSRLSGRPYSDLVLCAERLTERMNSRLELGLCPTDLLIDAPPARREVEIEIDIYFPKSGEYRPLREVSPVVRSLGSQQFDDTVKRVRIYGNPRIARACEPIEEDLLWAIDQIE